MKSYLAMMLLPVLLFSQGEKEQQPTHKPTIEQLFNVKTVRVKQISAAHEQVNYGYIVAQDSHKVDVLAWYTGFVDKLFANTLYTKVQKGDALAKVYSPEVYKAKQDYLNSINYHASRPAPAMLKSAKTKLRLLGVSTHEIDSIDKERKVDEFTTIYAPISGWIFEKNINQGLCVGCCSFSPCENSSTGNSIIARYDFITALL